MSFKYNTNPVSSKKLIPTGEYDATIYGVTMKDKDGQPLVSKNGEDMQRVTFEVYTPDRNVYKDQYFTAESMAYFYKKLAVALGQEEQFKAGTFDACNFIGAPVKLSIAIEKNKKTGEDDSNIKAFLPANAKPTTQAFSAPRVQAPRPRPVEQEREMDPKDIPF